MSFMSQISTTRCVPKVFNMKKINAWALASPVAVSAARPVDHQKGGTISVSISCRKVSRCAAILVLDVHAHTPAVEEAEGGHVRTL